MILRNWWWICGQAALKKKFNNWYSEQAKTHIDAGNDPEELVVDLRWSVLKPLHARWVCKVYNELPPETWSRGWEMLGLTPYDPDAENDDDDEEEKTDDDDEEENDDDDEEEKT